MKTLYLVSCGDIVDGDIEDVVALARQRGAKDPHIVEYGFYGLRTRGVLDAYIQARGAALDIQPVVQGLGDPIAFDEMVNQEFFRAKSQGKSEIDALIAAHNPVRITGLMEQSRQGLLSMFELMDESTFGIGFFYGVPLTLAARLIERPYCPNGWSYLPAMDTIVVDFDADGVVEETGARGVLTLVELIRANEVAV